jgi:hypothetical protein
MRTQNGEVPDLHRREIDTLSKRVYGAYLLLLALLRPKQGLPPFYRQSSLSRRRAVTFFLWPLPSLQPPRASENAPVNQPAQRMFLQRRARVR